MLRARRRVDEDLMVITVALERWSVRRERAAAAAAAAAAAKGIFSRRTQSRSTHGYLKFGCTTVELPDGCYRVFYGRVRVVVWCGLGVELRRRRFGVKTRQT